MENNLLINLRKYRPRENTDPLENFVTEAFAHLLRSSQDVVKAFVAKINERLEVPIAFNADSYVVSTQENFNNKFPDLVIKWDDSALVFEHKIHSELHDNQLKNYRSFAQDHFSHYRLVLITAREYQHKQNPDCSLCWHNIYHFLKNVKDSLDDDRVVWYVQEIVELLWAEGLGPVSPINHLAIDHYNEAKALDEQMSALLTQAALDHVQWPLKSSLAPMFKDRSRAVEKRLGIEFCKLTLNNERRWSPGIFCGFILDGKDHSFDFVMGTRLHVAVVLDLNKSAQEVTRKSEHFRLFTQELKDRISAMTESNPSDQTSSECWTVIDNNQSNTRNGINWYHPLAIIQPMDHFFEKLHTSEEQLSHFIEQISHLQQVILDCPNFENLLAELDHQHPND
jgi:hypothetical protein